MSLPPPIRFRDDIEVVQDDEHETVQALIRTFDTILERTSQDYGHAVRAVHAKSHGILVGELIVEDGLPSELAQGLFAEPKTHKVIMRMSTNAGDILPDTISLPRGLAIKVLDVAGERLPGAEGSAQDFIMINGPVFVADTAKKFLGNLKLLAKTTDRIEGVKVATSKVLQGVNNALRTVGLDSTKLDTLGGAPNVDPIGEIYFSATPFRYGDYIAKFSLTPIATALLARQRAVIETSGRPDAIRETVREEMKSIAGEWQFCVQLCRDLDKQPVEDPTVEWDEADTPFQRVAIIRVPPQDSWDAAKVQSVDEQMRFSVWTGLQAHRPLGNINRARKETYLHSADFRAHFNGCPIREPR